ncbi:MAG: HpcH/HpaI aldolase/citrate lyase family protein, partial [Lachnospiraceae bacterium]|nr:HpcH/HpaI aldolase/citrate lyase family protein [Lachnospiraceae bacterium]
HILINSLEKIYRHSESDTSYIPKIFIRVRNPEQINRLTKDLNSCIKIISGFIIPKFSPENAKNYINAIIYANELSKKALYMMPIYENSSIIDLRNRIEILYSLKDSLSKIEDRVLNIRVGGNDLCHAFGFRRHDNESIHSIKPISNIFSDIVTIYGTDYIISGPVWEYYAGEHWKEGLIEEINEDKLCGFIGKTVIHPNQIDIVNNSYKVSKKDYQDAQAILNWNKHSNAFVSGSNSNERMNEYKTHSNWAQQILYLAEVFGTCD